MEATTLCVECLRHIERSPSPSAWSLARAPTRTPRPAESISRVAGGETVCSLSVLGSGGGEWGARGVARGPCARVVSLREATHGWTWNLIRSFACANIDLHQSLQYWAESRRSRAMKIVKLERTRVPTPPLLHPTPPCGSQCLAV